MRLLKQQYELLNQDYKRLESEHQRDLKKYMDADRNYNRALKLKEAMEDSTKVLTEKFQVLLASHTEIDSKFRECLEENVQLKKDLKEQTEKVRYLEPRLINQKK